MEPIFDCEGRAAAWRKRDVLFDRDGRARAFVRNHGVFRYDGTQAGWCEDGLYRDVRGRVIGFERDATGGPLPPQWEREPLAPMPELPPAQPEVAAPAPPAIKLRAWSESSWAAFLGAVASGT